MLELEKTYLAMAIPEGLEDCKRKEIIDLYIPKNSEHPKMRIRKNGTKYEITKKEPVVEGDASKQIEQNIILTEVEFEALKALDAKKIEKLRYYYPVNGRTAEVDVFKGDLDGLVVVDFEFETESEKDAFEMPDFCLADITQEVFIAGGMICGKTYKEIEPHLMKFGYKKIEV